MNDRMIYEMYHNTATKAEVQETVIKEAENRIMSQIAQYNNTLCYDEREDIAQECRIAILQALDTYDYTASKWETWSRKYIHNAIYNGTAKTRYNVSEYMRRKYNIQRDISIYRHEDTDNDNEKGYDGFEMPLYDGDSAEDIAIKAMEREKDARKLYRAVEMLSPKYKSEIVEYYGLYGHNPSNSGCNRTKASRRRKGIDKLREIYGATKEKQALCGKLDRVGEKLKGYDNRPIVIVRYGGCKDIDAVMMDGDSYYLITNATYEKLKNRNIYKSNCSVEYTEITSNTQVYGRCACDYF